MSAGGQGLLVSNISSPFYVSLKDRFYGGVAVSSKGFSTHSYEKMFDFGSELLYHRIFGDTLENEKNIF